MDHSNWPRAEAWLRYANDLNLGPFYLSRISRSIAESSAGLVPGSAPLMISAAAAAKGAAQPKSAAAASSGPLPEEVAHPVAAASSKARAGNAIQPPSDVSLFDARIENDSFERIREDIGPNCTRCKLHKGRTKIVFGVGNPKAELVFVGEGPGRDEDMKGEPFVGRAGKLLTQMIEAMGLRREDVYICNVVKCRPPENRLPEKDEIATCSPFLLRQLGCIQPKVICALGSCSAQTLLQTTQGISRFRGEWFDLFGAKFMATYHPAYLLRNPAAKGEVWKDLQKVMAHLGLEPKRR